MPWQCSKLPHRDFSVHLFGRISRKCLESPSSFDQEWPSWSECRCRCRWATEWQREDFESWILQTSFRRLARLPLGPLVQEKEKAELLSQWLITQGNLPLKHFQITYNINGNAKKKSKEKSTETVGDSTGLPAAVVTFNCWWCWPKDSNPHYFHLVSFPPKSKVERRWRRRVVSDCSSLLYLPAEGKTETAVPKGIF